MANTNKPNNKDSKKKPGTAFAGVVTGETIAPGTKWKKLPDGSYRRIPPKDAKKK